MILKSTDHRRCCTQVNKLAIAPTTNGISYLVRVAILFPLYCLRNDGGFHAVTGCQLCLRHYLATASTKIETFRDSLPFAVSLEDRSNAIFTVFASSETLFISSAENNAERKSMRSTKYRRQPFLSQHREVSHQLSMTLRQQHIGNSTMNEIIARPRLEDVPSIFTTTFTPESNETSSATTKPEANATDDSYKDNSMSLAMLGMIGFYKKIISPLLPPACRFVPTCSSYGVQAIQEFGPTKGGILIAWRILRCSPFGGKGYDPPQWPPVSYTFSSY
jgi:uncharacterized protein